MAASNASDKNDLDEAWKQASSLEIAINRLISGYPSPSSDEAESMQTLLSAIATLRKALEERRHRR